MSFKQVCVVSLLVFGLTQWLTQQGFHTPGQQQPGVTSWIEAELDKYQDGGLTSWLIKHGIYQPGEGGINGSGAEGQGREEPRAGS